MISGADDAGPAGGVAPALVQAALRAADELGRQVADVPVAVIAAHAGISRSTLLRRLGGSRARLDEAVRAAGVDPGGQPVRERALTAAAALIAENGLSATTMEAIATRADCAVDSLYAVYGGRDDLVAAVFERHNPIIDISDVLGADQPDLVTTVRRAYRKLAESFHREPRLTRAFLAEALARPNGPAVQTIVRHNAPRILAVLTGWLTTEIRAGRIRDMPLPLLIHQFAAPVAVHMLFRPVAADVFDLPDVDQTCDIFADTFVCAVSERDDPSACVPT